MAETPAPAVLRSLRTATAQHPLDRKLLLCRTIGEGRELLRALVSGGESWLAWDISTPRRLALELVGPDLAAEDLALADDFDQEAAVEWALHEALLDAPSSPLARLAEMPGFREAVAGAVRELGLAGVEGARLRRSAASNPALRDLLAEVLEGQRRWLAEAGLVAVADVLERAAARVDRDGAATARADLLHLLPGLSTAGATGRLVGALRRAGARVLETDPVAVPVPAGVLWEAVAEPAPLTGLLGDEPARAAGSEPLELFAASGPAEEVREVLRRVLAAGLSWDEVEIIATDPVVYGGALHALGQRLEVPISFAVGLPVERTRTGRAAAAYFRWIREGYPASEIRRLLEAEDLRPPGYTRSLTGLARRLRGLGVGWGHGRYLPALDRADAARNRPRRNESEAEWAERVARDREELRALRSLLEPLIASTPAVDLDDPAARVSPAAIAAGLRRFLELVPTADAPSATARDRFIGIADRIAARLTREMSPAAALAAVRRHLRIRVPAPDREGAAPWVSSGGHIHLSDVEHGGLTGRRVTFVVGLDAERFPGAGLQDPLLLDSQRRDLDPVALPTSADRIAARRFALAAALARLRGRVTLSYSAWDPVEARHVAPSPVMLHAFRAAAADPAASFEDMAAALGQPASAIPRAGNLDDADVWFSALHRDGILRDGTAAVRQAFPALAAGTDAMAALAGDQATPHHGKLRPRPGLDPRDSPDLILSASGLEDLGTCALRYFFKYVLRVRPPDDPEPDPDRWLDPLRRGSLLHAVFERTLREARERGVRAGATEFEEHALGVLAAEAAMLRREVPVPGEAVLAREMVVLREDVRSFVAMVEGVDERWEALELRFGLADDPPAELRLKGGTVRLRGAIDRVDRSPDGGLVVVDYKTGSTTRHERSKGQGLFHGGRRLQNVVYTAAAEAILQDRVERMEYHFPTRAGRNEVIGYSRAETRRGLGLLSRLLDMVRAGRFLPTPQGDDCTFCDFQAICRHRSEGFTSHTPLADWAAARLGELEDYADLRDVRAWEDLLLGELDADA
ncbi:MAG TPA: PD-(D/E)XK nuclease family protein [Longimicrobiales bacterium]|nr:PD-(D/E)XK nuclease family protein [Longimicrobiales bacterium]